MQVSPQRALKTETNYMNALCKFQFAIAPGLRITLKNAVHQTHLSSNCSLQPIAGPNEQFVVERIHSDKNALRTSSGQYLGVSDGAIVCTFPTATTHGARLSVEIMDNGQVALRANNGMYIGASATIASSHSSANIPTAKWIVSMVFWNKLCLYKFQLVLLQNLANGVVPRNQNVVLVYNFSFLIRHGNITNTFLEFAKDKLIQIGLFILFCAITIT